MKLCFFQVQFASRRLKHFMFKVTNGKVEKISPIFGRHSSSERDDDDEDEALPFSDKVVRSFQEKEEWTNPEPSSRSEVDPNGYRFEKSFV
jgi:malate synthase